MKLAIVILNWNGKAHLENYLPSVKSYTSNSDCEIIIADNGSTDDSVQFLKSHYPEFKCIELDKNYGFAGGYNKALKSVEADYYCLLNSDIRVTENWYQPILEIFEKNKQIAAIQPKILSDRNHKRFEHAGAAGGFIDRYGYPFCRGRIMDEIEFDEGQYNANTDIFWASGACLFIRSAVFHEVGGFDSEYFAHMEEIDLCWRIKNRGYRIIYTPESTVFHWGGATLEYNNPHKLFLNFRNSLWTLYKNYTGKSLRTILFKRMIIDGFAIIKFLITFNFQNTKAVWDAHMAYYQSKPSLKKQRAEIQKHTKIKQHPELLQKSIVMQFFLNSKRKFSDFQQYR